jgi:hypothetical protein
MEGYQVWFLRRDGELLGSFPDVLIAQHMVLGRVHPGDEVSLDTHGWNDPDKVESLQKAIDMLIGVGTGEKAGDPEWRADRMKAAVRWLDERKAPDRRSLEDQAAAEKWAALRGNKEDRRKVAESPEILAYRSSRAVIEASLRRPRRNYKPYVTLVVIIVLGLAIYAATFSDPVQPYHIDWESLMDK